MGESSWWEQRHWGVTIAVDTLAAAKHPLAERIRDGFANIEHEFPSLQGYEVGQAGDIVKCGNFEIGFDKSGAVSHLVRDGVPWADANHAILQLKYRSYSANDGSD